MLKMVLAEDEAIVRRGLKNIIHWEELGIEIIAEACDGKEAFELCQKLNPDILFTDIRMPILDGLELAMELKESGSPIRIVFISGAQDFNYAKTALDVDADGYILKPVNVVELNEVFKKVINWINMERNKQSEIINLKQQLHEQFPVIRDKFLLHLILGAYTDQLQIQNQMQYYKIPLKADESLLVAVLQIDDYFKVTENTTEEYKQLLIFSISNVVEEIISNYDAGISFSINDNELIIIFHLTTQVNGKYNKICEELVACIGKFLKISVSIGIGSWVNGILSVNSSYKDAHTALQYKFYTGKNSILDISDINIMNGISIESVNSSSIYENISLLMNFIKLGDGAGVLKTLNNMFEYLCSHKNIPVEYIQSICVEMVCIASRTAQDLGKSINSIVGNQADILEEIYRKENVDDLKGYISDIIFKVAEYFSTKYNHKNIKVISRIKEIIEERYNESISVAKISEEIYLTPNYISMIFKQEMNETITEYIIKVRMEQAKNLLKATDLKILEIAREVGYDDPHYFSKAFKKYTGTHPQKYRE